MGTRPLHRHHDLVIWSMVGTALLHLTAFGQRVPRDNLSDSVVSFSCFSAAPIILTGSVLQVREIGGWVRSQQLPQFRVQPILMSVAVEHVLKGTVEKPTLDVLGFRADPNYGNAFQPKAGQLRLFLLRKDSRGQLRLVVDHVHEAYAPVIDSGRHPRIGPDLLSHPGKAVSTILLSPGEGMNTENFRTHVSRYAFISMAMTHDKSWVISLLEPLTHSEDSLVRLEATSFIGMLKEPGPWRDPGGACPLQTGKLQPPPD